MNFAVFFQNTQEKGQAKAMVSKKRHIKVKKQDKSTLDISKTQKKKSKLSSRFYVFHIEGFVFSATTALSPGF